MADHSAIEWTDATWNPVRGCVKVSPGCAHCYAETFAERFRGVPGHPYEQGFDLRLVPEQLAAPLSWKKPRRVFVNSMSDLFQDGVPYSYIDQVFAVMALAPQHTFQVLTKRPERMRDYVTTAHCLWHAFPDFVGPTISTHDQVEAWCRGQGIRRDERERRIGIINDGGGFQFPNAKAWPLPNVWLGVSVENQHFAKERIWPLLQTPASVRFISAEPLLGPVDLDAIEALCKTWRRGLTIGTYLDWVIVGGESGPGARKFDVRWAREIVAQCQGAGVPVFVKQLGAKPFDSALGRATANYATHATGADGRAYLRLHQAKGGDLTEWPEDLRVREWPTVRA